VTGTDLTAASLGRTPGYDFPRVRVDGQENGQFWGQNEGPPAQFGACHRSPVSPISWKDTTSQEHGTDENNRGQHQCGRVIRLPTDTDRES
jgi:hypothetical protein